MARLHARSFGDGIYSPAFYAMCSRNGKAKAGLPCKKGLTWAIYREELTRAYALADWWVNTMKKAKKLDIPDNPDDMSERSIKEMFAIGMNIHMRPTDRIAALRTVLEYTKTKPAQEHKHSLSIQEQWLISVAREEEQLELARSDDGSFAIEDRTNGRRANGA